MGRPSILRPTVIFFGRIITFVALQIMRKEFIQLSETYRKAGDALHDAIKECILGQDGFVSCSNNRFDKKDMYALVYDGKKGYTESFPIRALRVNAAGAVEVYIGTPGSFYTDKYLRGKGSEEHWMPLKDSNILFYQTILSIAAGIDDYLPKDDAR